MQPVERQPKASADATLKPEPIADVYLLAVAADGKAATLALSPQQKQRLRPTLSRFDLVLVWAAD